RLGGGAVHALAAPPLFFSLWYSFYWEVRGNRDETVSASALEVLLRVADEPQYRQPADGFERPCVPGGNGDRRRDDHGQGDHAGRKAGAPRVQSGHVPGPGLLRQDFEWKRVPAPQGIRCRSGPWCQRCGRDADGSRERNTVQIPV